MIFPKENRVLVSVYGSLPSDSLLLVPVPTVSFRREPCRLHVLAAYGFLNLFHAAQFDLPEVGPLLAASGWRPHKFATRAEYEKEMVLRYGSVAKGRKLVAFESPHQTGLAVDFWCGGLEPTSSTIARQRETPLYRWLCANAAEYGWTPYNEEPWHWEFNVPLEAYRAGVA